MTEGRRWYVLRCKPRQEERVLEQLSLRAGIECYFPRIEVFTSRRRGEKAVRPLFPGYLFARLLIPGEWKMAGYTRGVVRVVGSWQQPSFIDDAVIETIRRREGERDRLIRYYSFGPREEVYIRSGPLRDLQGIFDRYVDDQGRVRILLTLIGYQASVELDAEQLGKQ